MQDLQSHSGDFKTYQYDGPSFPTEGFHRTAGQLIVDSVAYEELTEWEQKFAADMASNSYPTINEKQWGVLGRLIAAVSKVERRKAGGRT